METSFRFKLIINIEETDEENLVNISYPRDRTIGEFAEFIKNRLQNEGLEGDVYYLVNEYNRELLDEYKLGSELLPNDIPLLQSIIDNHSYFYAKCNEIETEENDETEEITNVSSSTSNHISNSMAQYLLNRINNTTNSLNSLNTLSQMLNQSNLYSEIDVLLNGLNRFNGPNISITTSGILNNNVSTTGSTSSSSNLQFTTNITEPNVQYQISYIYPPTANNPLYGLVNVLNSIGGMAVPRMEDIQVGLHKDDLQTLKVDLYKTFETKDKCDTCSICIDKFKEEDTCRELKCKHLFHQSCIDHWLDTNIKCPVCRMETGRGVPKL